MEEVISRAIRYAQKEAKPAAVYLADQFKEHDIVLLGEDHGIREDLEFVKAMIPQLYQAGVTNLGMEFGAYEDQPKVDELVFGTQYWEEEARRLQFHYNVSWPFREYQELYRAAYDFNRTLPEGSKKFRILHLSYCYQWQYFEGSRFPSVARKIFRLGSVEQFRKNVIAQEVMDKGEKILVLTGTIHAFTRYRYAVYDPLEDGFCRYIDKDLGHLLYKEYGERVSSVLFHQMFWKAGGVFVTPADGILEEILSACGEEVGVDIASSDLGELPDHSNFGEGYETFKLKELCDGYLFLKPASQLHGCTIDADFCEGHTLEEIRRNYPDPDWHRRPESMKEYWAWAKEFTALSRYKRGENDG